MSTLAERLRAAMSGAGLAGRGGSLALSTKTNGVVHNSEISRFLNGTRKKLSGPKLIALADALKVSVHWLETGEGEMAPARAMVVERLRGSDALEAVLERYQWPDVDIAIVDQVIADARSEAHSNGQDRPESAWHLRVGQIVRERTGRSKVHVPRPGSIASGAAPTEEESPEVAAHKAKKRHKSI